MMSRFALIAVCALTIESTAAFAPVASAPATKTTTTTTTTAIDLVPEQGRQLVAFSQDYLSKKAKESASRASNLTHSSRRRRTSSSSRGGRKQGLLGSLMTRILHHGEHENQVSNNDAIEEELNPLHHSEHEVLYPIVGFNLVDGRAVPTPGQRTACSLVEEGAQEEAPFGYWSSGGGDSLWA